MDTNIFSVDTLKAQAKMPLWSNRYKVTITGTAFVNENSNLEMYACKADLPQVEITTVNLDTVGHGISVPSKFNPNTITLTFYNTGSEYKTAYAYLGKIFDQSTHAICYYEDVKLDITVVEYNIEGNEVMTWKFTNSVLTSMSGISLAYADSTAWEQFTMTFAFFHYELS